MQQQPAAYEVECRPAYRQHELPEQHEPHEAYVMVLYAHVHYSLCEEWQHELQQAAEGKSYGYLYEVFTVFFQITRQKTERPALSFVA